MKKRSTKRKGLQTVNASSMADIAFLLLIFFLVSTEIQQDQGVLVRLPRWEAEPPTANLSERNVLTVLVNADNELLVEGATARLSDLRERTKSFVLNPTGSNVLASDPRRAVVSLRNDRQTNYATYLTVYNELQAAYREMRDAEAARSYGEPTYAALDEVGKAAVREALPMVISEAEPSDFARPDAH